MTKKKNDFLDGLRTTAPVLPGAVPFGMITGITALNTHFDTMAGIAQSVLIFAGASQLAMMNLVQDQAWLPIIILTVITINLRFAIYSASIAPFFSETRWYQRWLIGYLLTDQAYALSYAHFLRTPDMSPASRFRFYLGGALAMWAVWVAATILGYVLGAGVPPSWSLEFAVPLGFIALMVPGLRDRASVAAACTGGSIAVLAHGLPYNLGLFLAAICGITAGYLYETYLLKPASQEAN